jgi:hypothetical protein
VWTADDRELAKADHGTRQFEHPSGLCGKNIFVMSFTKLFSWYIVLSNDLSNVSSLSG